MINGGFTNTEISRALNIGVKTVKNRRENYVQNTEINEPNKQPKNGSRTPDNNGDQDRGGGATGESEDPVTIESGGSGEEIEFIGGKKNMNKKEGDEASSEANVEMNICESCGGKVKGEPEKCPHCGAVFED